MVVQYELSRAEVQQAPLFNPGDLHHILKNNVGLRLTDRPSEITQGGWGDTIPLSHLGGAKESLKFATLSALVLRNTDLDPHTRQQHLQDLTRIFESFAGHDHSKFELVPILILVYASLLNITSTQIDPKFFERRLPKDEEALLIDLYKKSGGALFPCFIFDKESHYYADFPSLRLHLTSDFNQLLEKRLVFNLRYYSATPMHYILITSPNPRFESAYDLSHYPLGKTGGAEFSKEEIVSHITVADTNISAIWAWMKQRCTLASQPLLPSESTPSYAQQCIKYCQDNKVYIAGLLGAGLFAGYKVLQYTQDHKDDHASQPGF